MIACARFISEGEIIGENKKFPLRLYGVGHSTLVKD